jgi:GMP synthase (glutamine-hydrolysing)
MRILAIVHEVDAGPGVFADVALAHGHELHEWEIATGQRCPEQPQAYDAVLCLGGSMDADQYVEHPWLADEQALLAALISDGRPVLGVCLGAQVLARADGGDSGRLAEPEIGWYDVRLTSEGRADPLLGPLGSSFQALQWHSCAFTPSARARPLAASERCLQAYRSGALAWGIQFHAEVTLGNFEAWITHHAADPDAGDAPVDPQALLAQTRPLIAGWNALGRGVFGRFLDQADVARAAAIVAR